MLWLEEKWMNHTLKERYAVLGHLSCCCSGCLLEPFALFPVPRAASSRQRNQPWCHAKSPPPPQRTTAAATIAHHTTLHHPKPPPPRDRPRPHTTPHHAPPQHSISTTTRSLHEATELGEDCVGRMEGRAGPFKMAIFGGSQPVVSEVTVVPTPTREGT